MQQVTLSRKEKQYQFFYLILMLLSTLIFLGIIFFKRFNSPFSGEDILSIQKLEEKSKFDQKQKLAQHFADSTFIQIQKLKNKSVEPLVEKAILNGINTIDGSFNTDIIDVRKDAYPQIAKFYKMYFEDKQIISSTTEDIQLFEKKYNDCLSGLKEKQNRVIERQVALKDRTQ